MTKEESRAIAGAVADAFEKALRELSIKIEANGKATLQGESKAKSAAKNAVEWALARVVRDE